MAKDKEARISFWAAHLTTIVSVTLVLVILGIIALLTVTARRESEKLLGNVELSVIFADSVSDAQGQNATKRIAAMPFASQVTFITRAQAMEAMSRVTGDNLEELLGVNFLSPEAAVKLKPEFASPAKLPEVNKSILAVPGVEEVVMPDAKMVETMNTNIDNLSWILGAIAAVLCVISVVLIHNTVKLTIYSRRFTIHTMQLVGATNGFIRLPIVVQNMVCGLIAGLIASIMLAGAFLWMQDSPEFNGLPGWKLLAIVCVCLLAAGAVICGVSAAFATTRYLRKDYGELFR